MYERFLGEANPKKIIFNDNKIFIVSLTAQLVNLDIKLLCINLKSRRCLNIVGEFKDKIDIIGLSSFL